MSLSLSWSAPGRATYGVAAMTVTAPAILVRGDSAADPRQSGQDPNSDRRVQNEDERVLRCRTCGAKVANENSAFPASDGRSRNVFANPSGRVFEILTLLAAERLLLVGPPTLEFTWFPGYAWRVALCEGCAVHLGWAFEATSPDGAPPSFYGLLTSELVEGP